jgi:hypothetical protein
MEINLKSIPKLSDKNAFTDYLEIRCLLKSDGLITFGDTVDLLFDDELGLIDEDEIDDNEKEDKRIQKIREIFNFTTSRSKLYKEYYPFLVDTKLSLKVQPTLTKKHFLYISLLLSSNLSYLDRKQIHPITHAFENLSFMLFKLLLPKNVRKTQKTEAYLFGSGGNSIFKGTLYTKIQTLADKLNLKTTPYFTKEEFDKNNVGDGGLDLVGWYRFSDKSEGTLMIFGQCACGENWIDKELESHSIRWSNWIAFLNTPANVLFTPRHYRKANGFWHKTTSLRDTVVLDRLRIIDLARQKPTVQLIKVYKPILNDFFAIQKMDDFD